MWLDQRRTFWHPFSDQNSRKIPQNTIPQNIKNSIAKKYIKNIKTIFKHEAEIDVRNHQQSVPKQAAKQIMEIMKIMFFWCVKTCKFIFKTMVVEGFAVCVRERKRYQTNIKNETKIHLTIGTKLM